MIPNSMELNAMMASMKYLQLKQETITHNIANEETPGFKSKAVTFEEVYNNALKEDSSGGSYEFRTKLAVNDQTSVRVDGNNVDMEKENIELFRSYMQLSALYQKVGGQFTNFKYILSQANMK